MRWRCPIGVALLVAILIGQSLFSYILAPSALAIDVEGMLKEGLKNQLPKSTQQQPIKVGPKVQKLDDLIPRQDIPYGYAPMIPLQGITINGLGPKAIASLGENYFVVRSNTDTIRMSDLYKENKQTSKANFVTVDCILHPYLAFTNRVYAETIERHLLPLCKTLLLAMLKVAVADYKQSDDADVRADIECNIAFLSLPLKILDPSFVIPNLGRVPQMVQADYDAVVFAKPGRSAIYDRNEDFTCYRPAGWYKSSPNLITFFRVKTWLARLSYPINDVTFESDGVRVNNFRRSVLLYRSLELARIDGKPAMDSWMRLVKGMFVLGAQVENWQEKNLYAHDYKSVFKTNSTDLKMTLSALSEPLYRTKLLLAVRKQKPLSLGSTSIFDLEDTQASKEAITAFKFIPMVGAPEDPWLRWSANFYPKPGLSTNVYPVALLDLNAWGAPQAGNFLLDSSWAMDDNMPRAVTELKRWVLRRGLGGQVQPVECRIWNLLSPSWRLLPDGIQVALRGENWANRKLESAFSAWLDSRIAIAPAHYAVDQKVATPDENASSDAQNSGDDGIGAALAAIPATASSLPQASKTGKAGMTPAAQGNTAASPAQSASAASTNKTGNSSSAYSSSAAGTSTIGQKIGLNSQPARTGNLGTPIKTLTRPSNLKPTATSNLPPFKTGANASTLIPSFPIVSSAPTNVPVDKKVKPQVARRAARGHFLDPAPDVYNRLLIDAQRIDKDLNAIGFDLEPNTKNGLDDYARLFQRFFKIAKDEVECKPLSQDDLNLLANIDMILDKIDVPLPAVFSQEPPPVFPSAAPSAGAKSAPKAITMGSSSSSTTASGSDKEPGTGYTMALGRPGLLYIILMNKTTKEWTLARGAVYTYYEQSGTNLTEDALLGKIDRGSIGIPYWAERFDFLQADTKK